MIRRTLIAAMTCCLALLLAPLARSAEPTKAVRGLANHVDVEYNSRLRSRADQSPTSTVLVRVVPLTGGSEGTPLRQRIEFIGTVAGSFDLRDFIEREDGRGITELGAQPITVGSQLPADAGTDLYSSGSSWFNWAAHYRLVLWTAVAMWVAVPVLYCVVRTMRRPAAIVPAPPAAPLPTIEEQLVEAIRSSTARPLTTDERGRLELLVFRYFGGGQGNHHVSDSDIAETFRSVRENPETRPVVTALERWLHARDGERSRGDAAAALEELHRSRLTAMQPPTRSGATAEEVRA